MKNRILNTIHLAFVSILIAGLTACSDWLDVRPKSEIQTDLHFERESGFEDQLTGVYTQMCNPVMYGREMTFGLMEVLAQNYDLKSSGNYYYAGLYDYAEADTRKRIDTIWNSAYNCIANLNLILDNIDDVNRNIFTKDNYYLYKGEALGLRAFLHFDMLRIFAPGYLANPGAPAIPYVTEYSTSIAPQLTVTAALDSVISDLHKSITLLEVDSLHTSSQPYYSRDRKNYFNYYAGVATLARVYLYKGDKANALKYAEEIIEKSEQETNSPFFWTHFTSLETTYKYECDRTFSQEQIFKLVINNLEDRIDAYFTSKSYNNMLSPSEIKMDYIYEVDASLGNDYRRLNCFESDGKDKYLAKFWQWENSPYNNIFPLIRKTEAYYIAAEVLKESDPMRAIELLNLVRSHRKLDLYPLPETLSAEEIQNEIKKEYRKEFLAEGQYFFYHKRLNLEQIEGAAVNARSIYVLPMPDNEVEFGNRE